MDGLESSREAGSIKSLELTDDELDGNVANFGLRIGNKPEEKPEKEPKRNYLGVIFGAYLSIGVIFGDIATSPIYVYKSIFKMIDTNIDNIIGSTSLIIWSFFFIVVIKYLCVILSADDNGQGGSFAMYSVLCRHLRISANGEKRSYQDELDRELTTYSNYRTKNINQRKSIFKRSILAQRFLLLITLISSALILGDGVLTPAVSVLSAVEGMSVNIPSMKVYIIPITVVVMIIVFLLQGLGTHRLSSTFSPVVLTWLIFNTGTGLYHIIQSDTMVFKALSPQYAIMFFYNKPLEAWRSLQPVLLSITGAEALFADMGHFKRPEIRLATIFAVIPCLIITYIGQASFVAGDMESVRDPFWLGAPQPLYWFIFVLSILVTIIASQALISASFSIIHQAISINCFPPIEMCHTSRKVYGQIYSSTVNYSLMVLSLITVLVFRNSDNLLSAYGVAVSIVMTLSTITTSIIILNVWQLHWLVVVLFVFVYTIIDGAYLTSNLLKLRSWGWYPVLLATVVVSLMSVWRWCKMLMIAASKRKCRSVRSTYKGLLERRNKEETMSRFPNHWYTYHNIEESRKFALSRNLNSPKTDLTKSKSDSKQDDIPEIASIPGACIFYTAQHVGIPSIFYQYLEIFPAVFSTVIFLHVRRAMVPHVVSRERLRVMELDYEGFYSVIATYGYMDPVDPGHDLTMDIFSELKRLEVINYENEIDYMRIMDNIENGGEKESKLEARDIDFSGGSEEGNPSKQRSKQGNKGENNFRSTDRSTQKMFSVRLERLMKAYGAGVTYIIGENYLFATKERVWGLLTGMRTFIIDGVFNFMCLLTVSATILHDLPFDKSVVLSTKLVA